MTISKNISNHKTLHLIFLPPALPSLLLPTLSSSHPSPPRSGGGGAPVWGNTAQDWASLVDHLQSKVSRTRLKIPLLYGIDAVHGNNNVFGATIFPHHVGLGATRNADLVRKIGAAAARETAAIGVRWAFSPSVSVCRDPRWGRCYESFSENPNVVSSVSSAEIDGWQVSDFCCCVSAAGTSGCSPLH